MLKGREYRVGNQKLLPKEIKPSIKFHQFIYFIKERTSNYVLLQVTLKIYCQGCYNKWRKSLLKSVNDEVILTEYCGKL